MYSFYVRRKEGILPINVEIWELWLEILKEKEKEYQEILKKYSIKVVNPHYATFGMKIADEMGIPVIPVLHNTYVWFDDQEVAHFKACDQYVSKYIAVSENASRYTIEKFSIPREKVQVIPNGLDVVKHQAMQEKKEELAEQAWESMKMIFFFSTLPLMTEERGIMLCSVL